MQGISQGGAVVPQRVLFRTGEGARAVAEEVARRGARRVLVVCSSRGRSVAERVCAGLEPAAWFTGAVAHVPLAAAERARSTAARADADLLVCVGGGSAVGFAKAVALTSGIAILAVPTTYAGSEATDVWGLTDGGAKVTGTDHCVLPATVVYDAALTTALPVALSVASGLNALAHCVDSLWAPAAGPSSTAMALDGAAALARGLRGIVAEPSDLVARETTLRGCHRAGAAFAAARSGLHHTICHVLGGSFGLPHAETHAVVLPHVLALNAPFVPEAAGRLARSLDPRGADDDSSGAVRALAGLYADLSAPRALAELGFSVDDVPEAARRCLAAAPPSNPAPVDEAVLTALLLAATTS